MSDTVGLCLCIYWGEKEHKSRCRNTNPSLPLLTAVCSPALPLAQSISSLLRRSSGLARSPGLHGWNVIATWMLSASLPCQYVICLVDTCGLKHRFHATLSKQPLSPRHEAGRAQGAPCCPHLRLLRLSCAPELLLAGGEWKLWMEPRCILYSMFLNFSLGNLCTVILIYLRPTVTYAAGRARMHLVRGSSLMVHCTQSVCTVKITCACSGSHQQEIFKEEKKKGV